MKKETTIELEETHRVAVRPNNKVMLGVAGGFALGLAIGFINLPGNPDKIEAAVQASVPGTNFSAVNCDIGVKGVCEAVAGKTIVYVTEKGEHAFVGHLLDLKSNRDLTEERMASLEGFSKAAAALSGKALPNPATQAAAAPKIQPRTPAAAKAVRTANVDFSVLDESNAVIHNADATGSTIVVFSDPNCGACTGFYKSMAAAKDIKFVEYLMPFLPGSVEKAAKILCSDDRAKALDANYNNGVIDNDGTCPEAERIINQNLGFANANAITSTPTLFNLDGVQFQGQRSLPAIRALGAS